MVAVCFAYVPALFGVSAHEILPSLVVPIAGDPAVALVAAYHLRLNRVPVDAIVAAFQRGGANLLEMANDEIEWWGSGNGGPSWFQQIQPLLRSLEPEAIRRRNEAIALRAHERSTDEVLRGTTIDEDWLSAEREVALAELEAETNK